MMSSRVRVEFLCWPSFCLSFSCALDGDYSITLKSARRRAALFLRMHFKINMRVKDPRTIKRDIVYTIQSPTSLESEALYT